MRRAIVIPLDHGALHFYVKVCKKTMLLSVNDSAKQWLDFLWHTKQTNLAFVFLSVFTFAIVDNNYLVDQYSTRVIVVWACPKDGMNIFRQAHRGNLTSLHHYFHCTVKHQKPDVRNPENAENQKMPKNENRQNWIRFLDIFVRLDFLYHMQLFCMP